MDRETAKYVAGACACFVFKRTSRTVTQLFDRTLAPLGIRSTQLVALVVLNSEESMTCSQLASVLGMDQTSFSRLSSVLARNGWIKVSQGKDKRVRTVTLTAKGGKLVDQAAPYWTKAQKTVVDLLGESALLQINHSLTELTKAMGPVARGEEIKR